MFNPKSNNLLDEQLAVSGLEMGIVQALPAVFAGIGAASSIVGGIMGARSASKQNSRARQAEKEQRELAEKTAKLRNEHNAKLDAAERANYYAIRDYNYEVQLKDWQRGAEIQDYKYLQSLKEFEKSLTISSQQLDLNSVGEQQAIESEQAALREAFIQQQFQRRNTFDELQQAFALANIDTSEQFNTLRLGTAETFNTLKQGTTEQFNALRLGTVEAYNTLSQGTAETLNKLRIGKAETFDTLRFGRAEQTNVLKGIKNRKDFGRLGFANTINALMTQNNIAKETALVEGLVEQGSIQATAQAGKTASKAQQSSLAKMQRGLMGLEAELSGNAKKAAIQLAELNASLDQEEAGVGLNLERLASTAGLNIDRLESAAGLDLAKLRSTTGLNLDRLRSTTDLDLAKLRRTSDLNFDRLRSTSDLNLERINNRVENAQLDARFSLDVMKENMRSNIDQTQRNIERIRLQRDVADLNTRAGMMLFPERLPYAPRPEQPPERIFVERQKAIPGYVPPAQQQSVWAPLISGTASAAGSLASIDFGSFNRGTPGAGFGDRPGGF